MLIETSEGHLVQPCTQTRGNLKVTLGFSQAMSSWVFNISEDEDPTTCLTNMLQCLTTLTVIFFLYIWSKFLFVWPVLLVLFAIHLWEEWGFVLHPPGELKAALRALPSPAWTNGTPLGPLHSKCSSPRSIVAAPLLNSLQHVTLSWGGFPSVVYQEKNLLLQPAEYSFANTAQHAVSLHGCKDTLLIHVQVVIHEDSQALFAELPPEQPVPSLDRCTELFHPRSRALHWSLLGFTNFLFTYFSCLLRSLLCTTSSCPCFGAN